MCGVIAAFTYAPNAAEGVRRAMARMQRRGPDDEGFWQEGDACLGHRRLSIIDLDRRAAQPMHSADGRYVIVFNGEIYNYRALRKELLGAGVALRTESDTEVLLELYAREGEAMLPKLRGMFAFVIWDRVAKCAFAARDPYGIKPLYLAHTRDGWLAASQVKALLATGLVDDAPDPLGQAGFWLTGSVPEPRTWYRDISALPAGSWCRIDAERKLDGPRAWFDIGAAWREAPACTANVEDAQARVRAAVLESVRSHLVADVPVGVFLSGGIDSGALAGLMHDAGAKDVQGITIAFKEFAGSEQDESPIAARIAQAYGITHHVRTVTRAEFEADLPRILDAMDQPSIDGINTWYAAKAVAELGLKVVVSGVGGDELFGGYPSFRQIPQLVARWNRWSRVPGVGALAGAAANVQARRSGNPRWRWFTRMAGTRYGAYWLRRGLFSPDQLPELMRAGGGAARAAMDGQVIANIGGGDAVAAMDGQVAANIGDGDAVAATNTLALPRDADCNAATMTMDPAALIRSIAGELPADGFAAVGMLESKAYLRNQLLRDSDWASMDHSVELRTPLVDAWLLRDLAPLLRGFGRLHGKTLLARSPSTPLPDDIIFRRKTGFGIPVERWLRESGHAAAVEGGSRGWARRVASEYAGNIA